MLSRSVRLGSADRIAKIFQHGTGHALPSVAVRALRSDEGSSRFAVASARQIGNRPARNRARRRVAHALSAWMENVRPGWQVVLIARPGAVHMAFPDLKREVATALRLAGVLEQSEKASK